MKHIILLMVLSLGISTFAYAAPKEVKTEKTDATEVLYPVVQDGKWGYMDQSGKIVIEPKYEKADYFAEGFAPVKTGKKVGYINSKGELVIPAQFDDAWAFQNGVAPIKIGDRLGYINTKGEYVWNPSN